MNQVLGLYNYWIVIFLMMTGFYIVIARTNLIQKVIGLNIFQISVFLLYITMGKITGGTAPILQEHDMHHGTESHSEHVEPHAQLAPLSPSLPGAGATSLSLRESRAIRPGEGEAVVDLAHTDRLSASPSPLVGSRLSRRESEVSLSRTGSAENRIPKHILAQHDDATHDATEHEPSTQTNDSSEVIYTHPLPSVLMLTAIVVGVATTAVALALIIRIGEAYGTIEEDEILALDRETT